MAVIASIARRTSQSSATIAEFLQRFENRIQALSRVHERIARGAASAIELQELVEMEMEALGLLDSGRVQIEGPSCLLDPKQAETLALALHELGTNTIKHGALATNSGKLLVSWACSRDGHRYLEWVETGVKKIVPQSIQRRGYGRELIEVALPHVLRARPASFSKNPT